MDEIDCQLLQQLEAGLAICSRPYLILAQRLTLTEHEVLERLQRLKQQGVIKRFGVIVKHRHLGYQANAMVVFDIPDALVDNIGKALSEFSFVNLCYLRPRHGEQWPYNLFCMIHGKNRATVLQQLADLISVCELNAYAHHVLFSKQCFKQRGAHYRSNS